MPHANPTPAIAYASLTGSADVSSAASSPHAHPATPLATPPCNEPQTTNDKPQTTNNSPSPTSSSALALFLQVLHIAMVVVSAIAKRMDSDLHCLTLLQGCEAINCLYSIIRIQLTIDRHPERITPAELRRLAKASRYINRLARQKLDFSPFLPTDNPPSTNNEQQTPANKQQATNNKPSPNPQFSLPRLNITGLRSTPVCHSPGATLARTCQSLCRLLKLLPDLAYDPSGTVPTLDLTNSVTPSPATLPPPGARASSPASAPAYSGSPLQHHAFSNALPSQHDAVSNPLPSQHDAVSRVRQPCCRFSSPIPTPATNPAPAATNPAPSSATPVPT